MAFYGDWPETFWVGQIHDIIHNPMSTAIVRVYTHEGFVIAADGRMTGRDTSEIVSDSRQKIFSISEDSQRCLSYAACGTCLITGDDGKPLWDLLDEIGISAMSLAGKKSKNIYGYAQRLSRPITKLLETAKHEGSISNYPENPEHIDKEGSSIADVLISGYLNGIPSNARIRIFHREQVLQPPSIYPEEVIEGRCEIRGSATVGKVFFDPSDNRLIKYSKPRQILDAGLTIADAIRAARGYIMACSSDEGRQIDENGCANIGGHIHIATITPTDGFQWVQGFSPKTI